jgi:hypothetical protein
MVNSTKIIEIHPFQCPQLFDLALLHLELLWHFVWIVSLLQKSFDHLYTQCGGKKKHDCSYSSNMQEMMCMKKKRRITFYGFPLHSIFENNIFDPTVTVVQKLIKILINFLGPREEIGSPSQEHSFYNLWPNLFGVRRCAM